MIVSRWAGPTRSLTSTERSPAEFVQPIVVDPEVMADLVDHGAPHLLDDLVRGRADCADRLVGKW